MYKLDISETAKADIKEILSYIKNSLQNPKAATNLADLFTSEISSLARHPFSGTPVQDKFLSQYGFRYLLVKNFKFFYVVSESDEGKTVKIVRVLYARRDYESILSEEINT